MQPTQMNREMNLEIGRAHIAQLQSDAGGHGWEPKNLRDAYNLVFEADICPANQQLQLLEVLHHLVHMTDQAVRLVLVGDISDADYYEQLVQRVFEWHLADRVLIVDKLQPTQWFDFYCNVDVLLCLHPSPENASSICKVVCCKLPVLSRKSTYASALLGDTGWQLKQDASERDFAAAIWTLMCEPAVRRKLVAEQFQYLQRALASGEKNLIRECLLNLEEGSQLIASLTGQIGAPETWQIEGPFDSHYSLAIVNRELALALNQMGVDLALRSHEGAGDFAPSEDFLAQEPVCKTLYEKSGQLKSQLGTPDVAMRFCYPPYLDDMPANLRVVHSYGWEETGFPQDLVEAFNRRLDLVTVLSDFVGRTLRDNGVRIPIVVTGAGADQVLRVTAEALTPALNAQLKSYRFLHVSSCFPRKAADVLLRAYGAAFSDQDDVTLIVKTFPNPHNAVQADLEKLRAENPNFPHVVVIEEDWSQARLAGLYQSANAMVAPSRGEGLGLPIAEAMLFNLPVITTAWGGQTDFCDENTAWLCDYRFTKADTHLGLTNSLWAEPDQAHLSVLLKQLHGLSDAQIRAKTELAKARVSQQLTWQKTAENMRQAVQTVQDQALLRIDPKIGWISTWNARCGIANYSQFLTQSFPQDRLTILANHIPERMDIDQPNVVRCWNAEYDENFDVAFEEIIERQIDTVVFQYNFGFCAIEHLASLIARLRERGIGMHIFFHSTADVAQNGQMRSLSEIANYLQQAERIYVHSADDMNRLKSWQIVDNVVCFPHGITPPSSSAHRINKAVFANKKVIASYGFLLPHKGVLQLIEAFAQLDHAQHDSHLLLVNALYPSPISNHEAFLCRELMRQLGIEEKVTFITEFLSDADTHYALSNADVIVFPYQKTQESSSAAVRVGLATGKPVLVTPLAIFADVDEAVHQLPGTSPEQIAIGLTKFFNQSAPSQEKQAQIALWFAERSWPVLSTRLLNIIDGLANQLSDYPRNR